MKKALSILFCTGLALLAAGCPRPYPLDVTEFGNSTAYPEAAAGFTRYRIFSYRADDSLPGRKPDMGTVSVGYNMLSPGLQIASTIYITHAPTAYPGLLDEPDPVRAIFEGHKSTIMEHHAGAELLKETTESLTKFGKTYTALVAAYRFDEIFGGNRQPVYSVLMVWRHEDNMVKLRSTTPLAQGEQLWPKNLKLLDSVNWTVFPLPTDRQIVNRTLNYPASS